MVDDKEESTEEGISENDVGQFQLVVSKGKKRRKKVQSNEAYLTKSKAGSNKPSLLSVFFWNIRGLTNPPPNWYLEKFSKITNLIFVG